jgi:hypothetical protein
VIDADAALRLAARAFGSDATTWDRLDPHALARPEAVPAAPPDPSALRRLADLHAAQARPDPARVHPSWIERTLEGTPESIRRLANTDSDDPTMPPGVPDVLAAARALAAERLVGGEPIGPDDPPVVVAIADGRHRSELIRLLSAIALAKRAYLPDVEPNASWTRRQAARFEEMRAAWGTDRDPDLVAVGLRDLATHPVKLSDLLPRLGLVTLGRLLAVVDPFRACWTLQHLPYSVARFVRATGKPTADIPDPATVRAWESRVLDLASGSLPR